MAWFLSVCVFFFSSRLIVGRSEPWQVFNVSLRGRSILFTVTSATLPTISKYYHSEQHKGLFCGYSLESPSANVVPVRTSCLCLNVYSARWVARWVSCSVIWLGGWLTHRWKPRDRGNSAVEQKAPEPLVWAGYGEAETLLWNESDGRLFKANASRLLCLGCGVRSDSWLHCTQKPRTVE